MARQKLTWYALRYHPSSIVTLKWLASTSTSTVPTSSPTSVSHPVMFIPRMHIWPLTIKLDHPHSRGRPGLLPHQDWTSSPNPQKTTAPIHNSVVFGVGSPPPPPPDVGGRVLCEAGVGDMVGSRLRNVGGGLGMGRGEPELYGTRSIHGVGGLLSQVVAVGQQNKRDIIFHGERRRVLAASQCFT